MRSSWSPLPEDTGGADDDTIVRRFVEASRRAEIIALVNSARTDREVAAVAVDELCEALEAEAAFVVVTRPGREERETIGYVGLTAGQAAAVGAHPLPRAALGKPRPQTHANSDLLGLGALHVALAPWTAENGRQLVIGVARLYDEPFDPAELALLEAVTTSVGHALERAWLGAERDRNAARQAVLARAAKALSASLDGRDVLETLAAEVAAALAADVVIVYGVGDRGEVAPLAGNGLPAGALAAPEGSVLAADVAREGEARAWQPVEPLYPTIPGGPGSAIAAPIRPDGSVDGVVLAGYHGERWIEREDVELLMAFAELAGIAWRNAADHAAARRAAALDSLTGCLNHGAFQDRLREEIARAARGRGSPALVLFDLDDFKAVNDTLGHLVGDAMLRAVADALRESVRPYDQVARYGGDEFALLLPATDEEDARRVVERACIAVSRVTLPEGATASASAGVAHWRPGEEPSDLIERADRALLESKRERGSDRRGADRRDGSEPVRAAAQRERRRLRRLATAGSLGTRLARLLDQRAIAETAIIELGAALGYERCVLARRDADGAVVVVAAAREEDRRTGAERPGAAEDDDVLRRALHERRSVLATDMDRASVCSELAVPVYVGGRLWGAVSVRSGAGSTFDDDDVQLVQSVAEHLGAALRTAELYEKLDQTHLGTAEALAAALEAKDLYSADHARSIADLAVDVGRELGLDEEGLRELRYGAIFHDVGKIAIPEAILNKPGPLSDAELAVVRRHPAVGEQILAPVPFLSGVREIVRHDHERWDGQGYPDGLSGEEIPLGARIVLVVDAFHAMRSDRPYRRAMPVDAARAELLANAGTQFDPRIVDALLAALDRDPAVEPA
jgi:diguanylate cyclase (GGDEF)-like protein